VSQPQAVAPNAVVEIKTPNGASVRIGNGEKLSIIAGPCQMESRQHALETAHALKEMAQRLGVGLIYKT
jgi:2-dehydro-3-deoxyphosphooctonate aldolase (KDO 8-P synthase)